MNHPSTLSATFPARSHNLILRALIYFIAISSVWANNPAAVFEANGWINGNTFQILTQNGPIPAESFRKAIGSKNAHVIYSRALNAIYANAEGNAGPRFLVFFDQGIYAIGWQTPYGLNVSGFTRGARTAKDVDAALRDFEILFQEDPKELIRFRRYKGAFGPIDTGGRELRNVEFKGSHLLLTFLDGGETSTLEIGSSFQYIGSTNRGEAIHTNAVEVRPMQTLSEIIDRAEAKASANTKAVASMHSMDTLTPRPMPKTEERSPSPKLSGETGSLVSNRSSMEALATKEQNLMWAWLKWMIGILVVIAIAAFINKRLKKRKKHDQGERHKPTKAR